MQIHVWRPEIDSISLSIELAHLAPLADHLVPSTLLSQFFQFGVYNVYPDTQVLCGY